MDLNFELSFGQRFELEKFKRLLNDAINGTVTEENPEGLKLSPDQIIEYLIDLKTNNMLYQNLITQLMKDKLQIK